MKLHDSYTRKTVLYFTLHLSLLFHMQYAIYYAFCNSLQLNHFLFCNHLTLFLSKSPLNSLPILPLPSSFKEISSKLFSSSSLPIPFLFFPSVPIYYRSILSPSSWQVTSALYVFSAKLRSFISRPARRKTLHNAG